jgi:hypothetical protein
MVGSFWASTSQLFTLAKKRISFSSNIFGQNHGERAVLSATLYRDFKRKPQRICPAPTEKLNFETPSRTKNTRMRQPPAFKVTHHSTTCHNRNT